MSDSTTCTSIPLCFQYRKESIERKSNQLFMKRLSSIESLTDILIYELTFCYICTRIKIREDSL